jgi:hypothetical protein
MATMDELERRIRTLEDIEAIKQLKYRYWRYLDLKDWDAMALQFAPHATVSYSGGKYAFNGVTAIMNFLRTSLGRDSGSVTIHHGHHPEIEITSDTTANGTWALYNYMFNEPRQRGVRIGAYYYDRYVRIGGEWRFEHVGYVPLFHEEWDRKDTPSLVRIDIPS